MVQMLYIEVQLLVFYVSLIVNILRVVHRICPTLWAQI